MSRLTFCLALALVAHGCAAAGTIAPQPLASPLPLQFKLAEVDGMTQTLSLSHNADIAALTSSLITDSALLQSLAGLQQVTGVLSSQVTGVIAAGAGNLLPPALGGHAAPVLGHNGSSVIAAGAGNVLPTGSGHYGLLATLVRNGMTYSYDDQTRELARMQGEGMDMAFAFKADGATHSWDATMAPTPDGTSAHLALGLTGAWQAIPAAQDAPPYLVMGGQMASRVDAMSLDLSLVPRGDQALACKLQARLDEPQQNTPTHWVLAAQLPHLDATWDSKITLAEGASTFVINGTLLTGDGAARRHYRYEAHGDEAARRWSCAITAEDAHVRLEIDTAAQADATLVSTDDQTTLGTITMDPRRPGTAVVHLADGTTLDWVLYPTTFGAKVS